MPTTARRLALCTVAFLLVGCSATGPTTSPTTVPAGSPTPSLTSFGAIEHATGAADVVLRFEVGGGFVPRGFLATEAPTFTLYGDGTVIFQSTAVAQPPADSGSLVPKAAFRTATLTEDQIQDLLAFALGQGGLGIARSHYDEAQVADAPTATFTVAAGGIDKTVSVYALGMDGQGGTDTIARAAFQRLASRLSDFDQGGSFATDVYRPAHYRGVLSDGSAAPAQIAWPWTTIAPKDFPFPADPNVFQSAQRVLSPEDVAALGIKDVGGGFVGLGIAAPAGGKVYSLALRPLLPDETT